MGSVVILDANFILVPAQLKLDIYSQLGLLGIEPFEVYVYRATIIELEHKIQQDLTQKTLQREFRLAKQLLTTRSHKMIEQARDFAQPVDDWLIDRALELKTEGKTVYLATNDKQLRQKCKQNDIKSIFVRGLKKLVVE
jgi:rRNA-processing protein FCF1